MRFGKYVEQYPPGLHFRLPYPIDEVRLPKVTRQNIIEVGSVSAGGRLNSGVRDQRAESLMLTGDENIVDIDFVVFWRINDADKYLFNIQNPDTTVKEVAESAMREVVGQSNIQPILTQERQKTEEAVQALMQQTLDSYGAGIQVDQVQLQKVDPPGEVIDAFRDVQAARADKERLQNEAYAYFNKVVPEARGEAERILQARRGLQAAGSQRRHRSDVALPAGLRPVQERARRHAPAHVPGDHGARARRHRQDHPRQQGRQGVVPYLPLDKLQSRPIAPPREATDHARVSRLAHHYGRSRCRGGLCLGVHRASERAGARAALRRAKARREDRRASTGRYRSSTRSRSTTSASSISTASRRRSPPPTRSVSSSTASRATRSSIR